MAQSIQDLLGYTTLTGMIQSTVDGLPKVLPDSFMKPNQKVIGNQGRYTVVNGNREVARVVQYGSPAKARNLRNVSIRDVSLLHTYEYISLSPLVLQALRNYTNYDMQNLGKDEVVRQVSQFKLYFENLRTTAITAALVNGALWIDSDGNLMNTDSGATQTVDFQIPAGNKGLISTVVGAGGAWNSASNNIPLTLRALRQKAVQETGYEVTTCFYGKNVPDYLTENNYIKDYLAREPTRREKILASGDLTPEYTLEGIKFYPGYTSFWKDQNEANQVIIGDNDIIFTPDPSPDWWGMLEGTFLVPTTLNIQSDAKSAMDSLDQKYGMFAYAQIQNNPVSIQMYAGDTFLPVVKVPAAIWQLTAV